MMSSPPLLLPRPLPQALPLLLLLPQLPLLLPRVRLSNPNNQLFVLETLQFLFLSTALLFVQCLFIPCSLQIEAAHKYNKQHFKGKSS
jgi:hypothetical protein